MSTRHVATAVAGDFNLPAEKVADIADLIDGDLGRGHGPDHIVVTGARVVAVHRLGKNGSDAHEALLYVLDVDGVEARLLAWNVWVGQKPPAVLETLRELTKVHRPDVIVLNEAYRLTGVLPRLRRYEVHQGPNVDEGADVAILVQRRHTIRRRGVLRMREQWTVVSKNRTRAPREYPFLRVRLAGGPVLRVLGIHYPTEHPTNETAGRESITRTIRWARPKRASKKEHR